MDSIPYIQYTTPAYLVGDVGIQLLPQDAFGNMAKHRRQHTELHIAAVGREVSGGVGVAEGVGEAVPEGAASGELIATTSGRANFLFFEQLANSLFSAADS